MRSIWLLLFFALAGSEGLFAGPCVTASLAVYDAMPHSGCQVGTLTVKDFSYTFMSGTVMIADTDITVTPITGTYMSSLMFSSMKWNISAPDTSMYLLGYTWDPGDIRSLEDILNTSTPVAPGLAKITTTGCRNAAFSAMTCPTSTDTIMVSHDGITPMLMASVMFSPSFGTLGILETIDLDASKGGSSEFSSFGNNLNLVPEPSTLAAGLLGALLMVCWRRFKRD
jgi:hypothetical protein